jgi:hypothetical protein
MKQSLSYKRPILILLFFALILPAEQKAVGALLRLAGTVAGAICPAINQAVKAAVAVGMVCKWCSPPSADTLLTQAVTTAKEARAVQHCLSQNLSHRQLVEQHLDNCSHLLVRR